MKSIEIHSEPLSRSRSLLTCQTATYLAHELVYLVLVCQRIKIQSFCTPACWHGKISHPLDHPRILLWKVQPISPNLGIGPLRLPLPSSSSSEPRGLKGNSCPSCTSTIGRSAWLCKKNHSNSLQDRPWLCKSTHSKEQQKRNRTRTISGHLSVSSVDILPLIDKPAPAKKTRRNQNKYAGGAGMLQLNQSCSSLSLQSAREFFQSNSKIKPLSQASQTWTVYKNIIRKTQNSVTFNHSKSLHMESRFVFFQNLRP